MRLQLSHPSLHSDLVPLPWQDRLADWRGLDLRDPGGMHRHVVQVLQQGSFTYVLKELPDRLALHEYSLLRALHDAGLPTAEPIGVVTERADCDGEGILVSRFVDFSLPYRVLLAGRGLKVAFLGERLLDALVGLLARLHLVGFFWGDCSLFNTLFRRDAGALVAFVIDLETGEMHDRLSDGQRELDVQIAVENVAGGLFDLQCSGRLDESIDPFATATEVERRYHALWQELTGEEILGHGQMYRVEERVRRLHELGFDVGELELRQAGSELRLIPRVVELGYYAPQLAALTGLRAGENQARRLLSDIRCYQASETSRIGRPIPETMAAARWHDRVYEPTIAAIPVDLDPPLEPAEFFHQLLDHRWFQSERAATDVGHDSALASFLEVLRTPRRAPERNDRIGGP